MSRHEDFGLDRPWEQPLYAVTIYVHAESAEAAKREVGKLGSRAHPEGIWVDSVYSVTKVSQ